MGWATDPVHFSTLICESRRLYNNLIQALWFALACNLALTLILLTSALLHTPHVMDTYHVYWLTVVVIPLLSVSLITSPRDASTLRRIGDKNKNHLQGTSRVLGKDSVRWPIFAL